MKRKIKKLKTPKVVKKIKKPRTAKARTTNKLRGVAGWGSGDSDS